jgi:hypothetical protein
LNGRATGKGTQHLFLFGAYPSEEEKSFNFPE